jgi:hypothetical protein
MSKIQVTTALERQIPEFIREDYTTFVKFVKAYYEFLSQTDSRNLEDIRSIDKTLDEFVSKFKKELAALFPTSTIQNERMFLEHISDFYNSRGSVESYKLLFRVLFNKDAEIFYPSTQILKLSDGKWVQDKSVFVKAVNGNLFSLKGKIIQIATAKKAINVFSPNVVLYRDDIFEVFLDKQYYDDIEVGDIVSFDGIEGIILPCPAKYKISKEGKGFEAGSIYNLPTAQGNGSVIKITRVGSQGEIKAIQIISFGLDYSSNFYAQLSNKTTQALAFYHPITEFIAGLPRDTTLEPTASYGPNPASQEQLSDYINYGYFITQNYFFYDTSYFAEEYDPLTSVQQSDMLQTVWFADTTYVGDIIASFYTNEAGVVIDEDAAEIKIELGPVAVYPGYYASNDGFISDESYMHDGDYYQLYSYVVKVEEQLENYKEIVRTLLQPSGLKLFGEYNIYKNFDVIATPLLAYIRRQLFDQIFQINETSNKSQTKSSTDFINNFQETPLVVLGRTHIDELSFIDGTVNKTVNKAVTIEDNFAELIDNDISSKNSTKLLTNVLNLSEVVEKSLTRFNEDFTSIIDALVRKDTTKLVNSNIVDILDANINNVGLNKQDFATADDFALVSAGYGFIDRVDLTQFVQDYVEKTFVEDIPVQDILFLQRVLFFGDVYNSNDTYAAIVNYIRSATESLSVQQEVSQKEFSKLNTESVSASIGSFILSVMFERLFEDTINNFIEGSALLYNPFSAATITGVPAERFFAEEYAAITTINIT